MGARPSTECIVRNERRVYDSCGAGVRSDLHALEAS
jgi:hypothetical protein